MEQMFDNALEAIHPLITAVKERWVHIQPQINAKLDELGLPDGIKDVLKEETTWLAVAAALLVLLLTVVIKALSPSKQKGPVLLVGPCDTGKTTLFHQLRDGKEAKDTVSSMKENDDTFVLAADKARGGRSVRVVDIPGHPRVRGLFRDYTPSALGVVFLINGVDFMAQRSDTAEQLVEILTHPTLSRSRVPVLLAVTRDDLGTRAYSADFLRKMLEKEIEGIRGTRGALDDGSRQSHGRLGKEGEPFTFAAHTKATGVPITMHKVSCLNAAGIEPVVDFVHQVC